MEGSAAGCRRRGHIQQPHSRALCSAAGGGRRTLAVAAGDGAEVLEAAGAKAHATPLYGAGGVLRCCQSGSSVPRQSLGPPQEAEGPQQVAWRLGPHCGPAAHKIIRAVSDTKMAGCARCRNEGKVVFERWKKPRRVTPGFGGGVGLPARISHSQSCLVSCDRKGTGQSNQKVRAAASDWQGQKRGRPAFP